MKLSVGSGFCAVFFSFVTMADAKEQTATRAAPVPNLPPVPDVNWTYDEETGRHVWMHSATDYEHLLFGGNSFWPLNQRERYTGGELTIETFIARYGRLRSRLSPS